MTGLTRPVIYSAVSFHLISSYRSVSSLIFRGSYRYRRNWVYSGAGKTISTACSAAGSLDNDQSETFAKTELLGFTSAGPHTTLCLQARGRQDSLKDRHGKFFQALGKADRGACGSAARKREELPTLRASAP